MRLLSLVCHTRGVSDHRRMTAAERAKLSAELASVQRAYRTITRLVWAVAIGVMAFGLGVVTDLLNDHNFPQQVAWLLSPVVDLGLVVGLFGTQLLARYGIPAGWIGALRWVSALLTWGLNTASSWTAVGGPDALGVVIHSVGPVILFFVAEAAAYFQNHMSKVIERTRHRLDTAEQDDRAERAERAAAKERIARLEADLAAAERREKETAEQVASLLSERDAERVGAERAVTASEQEAMALRSKLAEQAERLSTEHAERLSRIRAELTAQIDRMAADHAERVERLQAEHDEKIAALKEKTRTNTGRGGARSTAKTKPADDGESRSAAPKLTDDEAVAAMLRAHPEPSYEWPSREVHRITGAGFGRIPKLIAMVAEHHARETQTDSGGESADTDQEESRERDLVNVGA